MGCNLAPKRGGCTQEVLADYDRRAQRQQNPDPALVDILVFGEENMGTVNYSSLLGRNPVFLLRQASSGDATLSNWFIQTQPIAPEMKFCAGYYAMWSPRIHVPGGRAETHYTFTCLLPVKLAKELYSETSARADLIEGVFQCIYGGDNGMLGNGQIMRKTTRTLHALELPDNGMLADDSEANYLKFKRLVSRPTILTYSGLVGEV